MPAIHIKMPIPEGGVHHPSITLQYTNNLDGNAMFVISHEVLNDLLELVKLTGCKVDHKQ